MRLDKLLSESGVASRRETARACRAGQITVNGVPASRPDLPVDESADTIVYCGQPIVYRKYVYLLLNKPDGYVSATEDGNDPVVTELVPAEYRRMGIFPCGRLDKHTLGLLLLTNDGALSHRLLAPKSHVAKSYRFALQDELPQEKIDLLEKGVDIGGYVTKPCRIKMDTGSTGEISITEGKYHQIKRMMEAVGNKIVALERISFGPLALDADLPRGAWRELTPQEIAALSQDTPTQTNRKEPELP